VWSSETCSQARKLCAAVLGAPQWPGNDCILGKTEPVWTAPFSMTRLQLAQYNCAVAVFREKKLKPWRGLTKQSPVAIVTSDGAVAMAPPPPPPRKTLLGRGG